MDLDGMIDALVNNGPIVAYISASNHLFQHYGSGIINFKDCPNSFDNLDHAVTIVGYGTDKKTREDYWLVKNSWGYNYISIHIFNLN
jgi:cathepsin L